MWWGKMDNAELPDFCYSSNVMTTDEIKKMR
jgi:hypothetical protein